MLSSLVYGINAVISSAEAGRVRRIYISNTFTNQRIIETLKKLKVEIQFVSKEKIVSLVGRNAVSQGIVAEVKPYELFPFENFIKQSQLSDESIVLILDGIEDPHNFGAILRVCDAFSVDCVIFKNSNQVGLTETVAKVSTGAINYVKCISVSNLSNAIAKLKDVGYRVYASDGDAKETTYDVNFAKKSAIIIGSEGFGISRLVKENSDVIIKIPMYGHVNSLNASNAAAVLLYETKKHLEKNGS